jgi:hypothetical protein
MSLVAYRPTATVTATEQGRPDALASVRFAPTPTTQARLASYRLLFRAYPGGFRLAAQHDLAAGGGIKVPITQPLSLLFAFTSSDPGFLARYSKEAAAAAGPNLFLTNRNASGQPQPGPGLSRDAAIGAKDRGWIVPRRNRARVKLGEAPRPNKVEVRPYFGGAAVGDPIALQAPVGAEAAEVAVELGDVPGLAFILRPKPQGNDILILADDELARMNPMGALELVLKPFPGPDPAEGRAFTAVFEK